MSVCDRRKSARSTTCDSEQNNNFLSPFSFVLCFESKRIGMDGGRAAEEGCDEKNICFSTSY